MTVDGDGPDHDADFSLALALFPKRRRCCIRAFRRFVRLADRIADNQRLSRKQKLRRLRSLQAMLNGQMPPKALEEDRRVADALRQSLQETGLSRQHAHRVVGAFERDVSGVKCETWAALLDYCQLAAAPIGRYVLEALGEDAAVCGPASDALYTALRVLRRLRGCRTPRTDSARPCIPVQFMRDAFISVDHFRASSARGQTRAVIDRVLDGVDRLLDEAEPLPRLVASRALRINTLVLLCRAGKLAARLRRQDPLQETVDLNRWERLSCTWLGAIKGLLSF